MNIPPGALDRILIHHTIHLCSRSKSDKKYTINVNQPAIQRNLDLFKGGGAWTAGNVPLGWSGTVDLWVEDAGFVSIPFKESRNGSTLYASKIMMTLPLPKTKVKLGAILMGVRPNAPADAGVRSRYEVHIA